MCSLTPLRWAAMGFHAAAANSTDKALEIVDILWYCFENENSGLVSSLQLFDRCCIKPGLHPYIEKAGCVSAVTAIDVWSSLAEIWREIQVSAWGKSWVFLWLYKHFRALLALTFRKMAFTFRTLNTLYTLTSLRCSLTMFHSGYTYIRGEFCHFIC